MKNEIELLTTGKYLLAVQEDLKNPKTRHALLTLFFVRGGEPFDIIIEGLLDLLKRGGTVHLKLDAVFSGSFETSMVALNFWPFKRKISAKKQAIIQRTLSAFELLKAHGAQITYVRPPTFFGKMLPSYKRDHRKSIVLYDQEDNVRVVYTGSCNIHIRDKRDKDKAVEAWLDKNDFMLRITEPELATCIANTAILYNEHIPSENQKYECNSGVFYLTVGNGKSQIRNDLLNIIKSCTNNDEIILGNQMTIDPFFAYQLRKAGKRGTRVELILPNQNCNAIKKFPYGLAHAITKRILSHKNTIISHMNYDKWFTHTKSLYIRCNGKEYAYSGSENIAVIQGIILKTVDDGLITQDRSLVSAIKNHLMNLRNS